MTPERPLVLVGAGNMGGAMLSSWLAAGTDSRAILVIDPAPGDDQPLHTPGLRVLAEPPQDLPAAAIVIAVKPQTMGDVLPKLTGLRRADTLVLSIAAGITLATLGTLGPGPLVRAIPNTPAAIGKGVTAAVARDAGPADVALADRLLRALGHVEWLEDEALIDVATAISGSGPAYVFHLVECLAAAGEAEGLPGPVARSLARRTVIGAGALLEHSELDPETLRRNVTSPGGTTAAALSVLMETAALKDLMACVVSTAIARSRELGS